ncbi:MAG: hypothetical protein ACI4OI_06290 [Gemmiger sp.]
MKRKLLACAALGLCLALTLTACSPKELLGDMIYNTVKFFGFIEESDDDTATENVAAAGGVITFPEGMDTTARLTTQVAGDTLYVSFKGIQNRNTPYFTPSGDSLTLTAYATTDSTKLLEFKTAVWELGDDMTTTSFVQGTTVYYPTGGDCYTQTVTGLTPGKRYKVNISYDSSSFYITGGLMVQGLSGEELTDVTNE